MTMKFGKIVIRKEHGVTKEDRPVVMVALVSVGVLQLPEEQEEQEDIENGNIGGKMIVTIIARTGTNGTSYGSGGSGGVGAKAYYSNNTLTNATAGGNGWVYIEYGGDI